MSARPCASDMTEWEMRQVMIWLDASIDIYRANEGRLSVSDISVRSLLAVARDEIAAELKKREHRTLCELLRPAR